MKKTFIKTYPALVSVVLLLATLACEKDVILDLADSQGKYIIVDANITNNGNRQWINLFNSSSYYDATRGLPVTNASVTIQTDSESFQFQHSTIDSLKGYYYNDKISRELIAGDYQLIIETPDELITGRSLLRPVPVLDSVTIKINPFSQLGFFDDTIYDIFAHFRFLQQPDDFFLFNLFINDSLATPRPSDKSIIPAESLEEYVSLAIFNFNKNNFNKGDTISMEIRSISEENFEFYNVFFFQTDLSGNPFAGAPPANIPTNLSQGARGFFQVSSVNNQSVIYNGLDW